MLSGTGQPGVFGLPVSMNPRAVILKIVEGLSLASGVASLFAHVMTGHGIPDDKIHLASHAVFQRIKLFSLFTKHHGFKEENEWRVVYLKDRDPAGRMKPMMHYASGIRGVEPKLRYKIAPMQGLTNDDLSLGKTVHSILLGPTLSSPLAVRSVERMLEVLGKAELTSRLQASSIPFRPL